MTEHGVPHHASIGDLVLPTVNFLLFAFVLVRFLAGPVREYFRARTERLREALEAGARARQEATALRATLLRDIERLPAVKEQLRNDLRVTAERERETIVAQARQVAERLRTDARLLAEHEFSAAREGLRAEVIEETIRQATAVLRDVVRPDDQVRFVREFVQRTGAVSS
jgi:F-type H+-transporting ATPase subunit b